VPKREKIYTKSITVRITEDQRDKLREVCEKKGYSNISVCLRDLIDAFIKSAQ
jgi:Arc/MetJ-type ribon-helix-helix transcriptional regulator